jgi:opacity protein-like surface antigen
MTMHRVAIFFMIVLLGVAWVQAAEVATDSGARALIFRFDGLDRLGLNEFDGGLGLRYYVADGWALRSVIGYEWYEREEGAYVASDVAYSGSRRSSSNVDFSVLLERRLSATKSIHPYLGFGVEIERRCISDWRHVPLSIPDGYGLGNKSKATGYGALAVLGFEYGLLEKIALGGEYRVGFMHTSQEEELHRQGRQVELHDDIVEKRIGVTTAALYLAIGL